jgi:hypothetical protein
MIKIEQGEKMHESEWLEIVAYKKLLTVDDPMNCSFEDDRKDYEAWLSKFDDSYITMVGMENNVKTLADLEITEELSNGIGYSPKTKKWYGWSHRATCGFGVGSTCKKGDCHYKSSNEDDEIDKALSFWEDDQYHDRTWVECVDNGEIEIRWLYNDNVPNTKLRRTKGRAIWNYDPKNFGRGEWVAKTMSDAKQMAMDFRDGVS